MKVYNSIDEWSKNWTEDKQKRYEQTLTSKYNKCEKSSLTINDKELSNITGAVRFIIPTKYGI